MPRGPEAARRVDLSRGKRKRAEVADRAASIDRRDAPGALHVTAPSVERDAVIPDMSGLQEVHDDEIAVRSDGRKDTDPTADAEVDRQRPRETPRHQTS